MRKHGWQLPHHPLQVVAVAVFLALGFAFYVFFAPFVGKQLFQYLVMGIYTPLLICSFVLYIWCAAADPADPGVFKSKKYLKILSNKDSKRAGEVNSSIQESCAATNEGEANCERKMDIESGADRNTEAIKKNPESEKSTYCAAMVPLLPCTYFCNAHEETSDQLTEDGMFYCSLCEVEVFKYSKHCRVCDKCVDRFDHHCRWLNNCIGKRNYRKFFTLMVSAILLVLSVIHSLLSISLKSKLVLQWSTGILVLILCFLEKKRFATDIGAKLGSSFTVVPFVIVVAVCTVLAMIATLPLAQLFFFHILLIKKGISTYDYIIALREQEQQVTGGQQSPPMSPVSNLTGLSSASSLQTFHRAPWCTPPRLFVEDQFDVVPPDNGSVSSLGRKTMAKEEQTKKKNPSAVKISPWTLARLNAEDVSKAAAEARKKSKILHPVARHQSTYPLETDSSIGSSSGRLGLRPDNNRKRGSSGKRIRLPVDVPFEQRPKFPTLDTQNSNTSFAPLQLEARSAFRVSQANVPSGTIASSPESSLDSPNINPLRVSSSGPEESRRFTGLSAAAMANQMGNPLSRSTSDGYEASGGEDSDRVPTRFLNKSSNWRNLLFGSETERSIMNLGPGSSSSLSNLREQ